MDIESKLSEIIQLLLTNNQNKKTSLQLHNDVFARINTLVYISQDPNFPNIPDTSQTLLVATLDEVREILNDLASQEDGILQMAKQLFTNSNLKKLEGMIPRLLKLSDQMIQTLTVQKYIDRKVQQKRRLLGSKLDEDIEEIEATAFVRKKVKSPLQVIPRVYNVQRTVETETIFNLKFYCDPKLNDNLPSKERYKVSNWCEDKHEDIFIIKRDDFLSLPKDLVVKISKEHAKLRGWKQIICGDDEEKKETEIISYEITDLSVNGTYYLGNMGEGLSKQKPMKLKGGVPFQLRDRDSIGILMNKETKTNETLVGFEFRFGNIKKEELSSIAD